MIRYGTIGTNFIVDRFQEAAMENPSLHYSAVYSRNQETAGNFAAKYGVETTYTDLNAFACADDLDAVYIASPNSFHYEQAALLLSHGKHVLCEKPITSNARELEHLIQLAGQNNVIYCAASLRPATRPWQNIFPNWEPSAGPAFISASILRAMTSSNPELWKTHLTPSFPTVRLWI